MTASVPTHGLDLQTQVTIETSAQIAAFGGVGSATRAAVPSGNLMLPEATTTTPVVQETPMYQKQISQKCVED